jgi:hypothetical protein
VKYRDQGLKPARGRSGNATLEARAILGFDGLTTLDVSTGVIDAASASGTLKKIQIQQLGPDGTPQNTTNYNIGTSPTFQVTLPGRVRGSKIQVQANITGIDGTRTDVVTVTESVKLRPHLIVDYILAPAQTQIGVPVTITGLVSEMNGDVGARADCVLAEDAVEIDRVHGIWVDAGRTVSCVFSRVFNTGGQKNLSVSVASVVPGDYDQSSNFAETKLQVLPRNAHDFTWSAGYSGSRDYVSTFSANGFSIDTFGNHSEFSTAVTTHRQDTWDAFVNASASDLGWPLSFNFHDAIDGTPLNVVASDPTTDFGYSLDFSYPDPQYGLLAHRVDCMITFRTVPTVQEGQTVIAWTGQMTACRLTYPGANALVPLTTFEMGTAGGDVAYFSDSYQKSVFADGSEQTYSFVGETAYTYGTPAFGTEYSFGLEVSGPGGSRAATGNFAISSEHISSVEPYSCKDFISIFGTDRRCFESSISATALRGFASGVAQ